MNVSLAKIAVLVAIYGQKFKTATDAFATHGPHLSPEP